MVTKGIITSIDFNGNTCQVRMPFFETAGNDQIIGTAVISNTPGSYNGYKVGDVVLVAFEDGQMETPVVIGKLYLGVEKEKADPRGVLNTESLTASKTATVPADTKLTTSTDKNLPNTMNPYINLSSIANNLNKLNTDVTYLDAFTNNQFRSVITDNEGLRSLIQQTAAEIRAETVRKNDKGEDGFGWSLTTEGWKVYNTNSTHDYLKDIGILTVDPTGVQITGELKILDYPRINLVAYLSSDDANDKDITNTLSGSKKIPEESEAPTGWSSETPFTGRLEKYWGYTVDSSTGAISIDSAHSTPNYDKKYVWKLACDISYEATTVDGHSSLKEVVKNITYECLQAMTSSGKPPQRLRPITDSAYELAQGKSTNYYSQFEPYKANDITELPDYDASRQADPESIDEYETYGQYFAAPNLKRGDCWFKLTGTNSELEGNPAKGELKQCLSVDLDDPMSATYGKATWEDIGGELVANKITANYINALDITAKKITVLQNNSQQESQSNKKLFEADGLSASGNVIIGNFVVDENSISHPVTIQESGQNNEYKFGKPGTVIMCTGTGGSASIGGSDNVAGWNFTAGENFGVRTIPEGETDAGTSELYVNRGKIGGFKIDTTKLYSGTIGSNLSVLMSPGYTDTISTLTPNIETWAFTAGQNFGVTTDGEVFAKNINAIGGAIGGFDIQNSRLYTASPIADTTGEISIKPTSIIMEGIATTTDWSTMQKNAYYMGIDPKGGQTGLGVFGSKMTRVYSAYSSGSWWNPIVAEVVGIRPYSHTYGYSQVPNLIVIKNGTLGSTGRETINFANWESGIVERVLGASVHDTGGNASLGFYIHTDDERQIDIIGKNGYTYFAAIYCYAATSGPRSE